MEPAGWAAIMTNPASEDAVEARLQREGWRTYCPRYRKMLKGVRIVGGRRVRSRGSGEMVMRALFPRYVFAQLDHGEPWHALAKTPGIAKLIMAAAAKGADPQPALLAGEIVGGDPASVR